MIGIFYYRSFFLFSLRLFFYKSRVTDFGMLQYDEIHSVILLEHIIFLPNDRFSLKDLTGYWDKKPRLASFLELFLLHLESHLIVKILIHPLTEPFLQYRHNKYQHHSESRLAFFLILD